MPWCPKCKAEFRAGFTTCNSCHVALIDHKPDGTEQYAEPARPEEGWLRDDPKRTRLLRILRMLIALFIALTAAFLLKDFGV